MAYIPSGKATLYTHSLDKENTKIRLRVFSLNEENMELPLLQYHIARKSGENHTLLISIVSYHILLSNFQQVLKIRE
jgi:hypothetical protein